MKTTSSNWRPSPLPNYDDFCAALMRKHEHLQAERGEPQNKTEQVEINQVVDRFESKRFSGRGSSGGRGYLGKGYSGGRHGGNFGGRFTGGRSGRRFMNWTSYYHRPVTTN
jgi:hypothetical protein